MIDLKLDLKKLIGDKSRRGLIYILGAAGILILFLSSISSGNEEETAAPLPYKDDYCEELEKKLEEVLPTIKGVGKVDVMITAKNYGQIKLAENKTENNKQTVVLSQKGGGEDAKVVEEMYPEIQGVIISAEGGSSARVKAELTEAVTALLGVDAHRIKVFERKTE